MKPKKSLFIVVGPTASGKSEFAVKLAKELNGEIVSADSRQVYIGLDLGSGKVPGRWVKFNGGKLEYLYKKVPHHLIDVASPLRQYSVARYQKAARAAILDIVARGKTPIICGGTGHWIDNVVFEQVLPAVAPDFKLRSRLNKLSAEKMFEMLKKLDPKRAAEIDAKNPRRLIRALEIVMSTGKPVPNSEKKLKVWEGFDLQWIGLNPGMEILEDKIQKRLDERFEEGLLDEVKNLHSTTRLSWKRLESFGLEYKFCALFLQKKITEAEMHEQLYRAIRQYAKRQMTWWKRNADIQWIKGS